MVGVMFNVTTKAQWLKRLPSWMFKLGAQAWIDREYPRHLFIETTALCDLSCSFCPREKITKHMDFQLFKAIVDEASCYGARSFSLHLFGEPLLYPRFSDAVRYIKLKNRRHTILLTTNGTQLNRRCDEVIGLPIDQVYWTWRPEAKFTEETKEKLRRWGRFRVRFIEEVTPPEAYEEWKDWSNVEGRKLHNYGGNIQTSDFSSVPDVEKGSSSATRYPCYHLWLAPAVAWNGNILICCADPHAKEVLGQFPEMSVHQAWKSSKLEEIRQSHLQGTYKGICSNCDVWKNYGNIFFGHEYPWNDSR